MDLCVASRDQGDIVGFGRDIDGYEGILRD